MKVQVHQEPITALAEYASVPSSFEVTRVYDVGVQDGRHGEFVLSERRPDVPYVKDYDAIVGEHPTGWASRFDLSHWGLFAARAGDRRVGGAAVAVNTPELTMLEGRSDLAVLWDIRVSMEARGHGVGSELFRAAEEWARARGCRQLKVETQNVNVPACRFYARHGCVLGAVNRGAYPELPSEIQLLWYKDLAGVGSTSRET